MARVVVPVRVIRRCTLDGAVFVDVLIAGNHGNIQWEEIFNGPLNDQQVSEAMEADSAPSGLSIGYYPVGDRFSVEDVEENEKAGSITMIYPVTLNSPLSELYLQLWELMHPQRGVQSMSKALAELLLLNTQFDDEDRVEMPIEALVHEFLFQILSFHIPRVIPMGKSEWEVYEEEHKRT